MNYKIVADSSSNIFTMENVDYVSVPLKIITDEAEYTDNKELDVNKMVEDLKKYKGKSGSSCPNSHEWGEAFEGADGVFAVTITSALSGSHSAALQAAAEFLERHPDKKICVIDTLSVGPEMQLVIEKLRTLINEGLEFEEIETKVREYLKHTHLLFGLQSLNNLARNGRINPAIAKVSGILGIRILGKASDQGTLQPLTKHRGDKKMIPGFLAEMENHGFSGQQVRISHCLNEEGAQQLKNLILEKYPDSSISINTCTALCSFYAEEGGMIVGFEDKDVR
ncbi:MAG: DegV family protein [Lachnospiraceae bacterium]